MTNLFETRSTLLSTINLPIPSNFRLQSNGVVIEFSPEIECRPMQVIWISDAEEQLRPALSVQLVAAWSSSKSRKPSQAVSDLLSAYRARINQVLSATFAGTKADAVVVTRLMRGYRRRQDLFLLLVEVVGGDRHGRHVVKIGRAERLNEELLRWLAWKGAPSRHDVILLTVEDGATLPEKTKDQHGASGLTRSLVYADANQHIGADRIVALEEAIFGAVLHETPSLDSVVSVLDDVYERLGRLMYDVGVERGPSDSGFVLELKHLESCLELLESGPGRAVRERVNAMPPTCRGPGKYFDPTGVLRRILLPTIAYRGKDGKIRKSKKRSATTNKTSPIHDVPGLLVGQSHGDLHARNIHVGVVGDHACWPAIFDYEDMSPANYTGWDFVKMETELKIRLLPKIFDRPTLSRDESERRELFATTLRKFEEQLNLMTELCRDQGWPRPETTIKMWLRRSQIEATPTEFELSSQRAAARLAVVLLAIRHQAHKQLGVRHDRVSRWLEEYYFLLMCYGVITIRYSNLEMNERIGSLVSAGSAAARMPWAYR